jgi:glycosyltransferase involved in cell wall biosynthesis
VSDFEPDVAGACEQVLVGGSMAVAYPAGRHGRAGARVTVAIPIRNAGAALDRCLASVLSQEGIEFDVVVVDNASTDDSFARACAAAARDERVTVYRNAQDVGRIGNWNRCLDLATGEYVKLMMVNDYLLPGCLAESAAALDAAPGASLLRTSLSFGQPDGRIDFMPHFDGDRVIAGPDALRMSVAEGNLAACPSGMLLRGSVLREHGLRFDESLSWAADYELSLRFFLHGDFAYLRRPLFVFDLGAGRTHNATPFARRFDDECAVVERANEYGVDLGDDVRSAALERLMRLGSEWATESGDDALIAELQERLDRAEAAVARELTFTVLASTSAQAAALEGLDVVVLDAELGRREALARAAGEASGDVCIALAPNVVPGEGFAQPLVDAIQGGAVTAGPAIETPAGIALGYVTNDDGALLPLLEEGREPHALALDCIAARRSFFTDHFPELDPSAGFYELQVAAAAGGRIAVCPESRVRRVTPEGGPPISVIVCSRDRAEELTPCVEALVAHGVLAGGNEIVLVDNASSDDTPRVVAALAERYDGVVAVHEEKPGLSVARDAGAKAASHDVLTYLDDDARVAPGWIESLRGAFANPDTTIAGGPIYGLWPEPGAVDNAPRSLHAYFSILSHGDRDFDAEIADCYGANWSIRRSALEAIGGFDERWGAGAGGALPGEETAAEMTLRRLGVGHSSYAVGAAVGHRIEAGRLTDRWLVVRTYRHGLILPYVHARFEEPSQELLRQEANRAGAALRELCPLNGALDVNRALAAILAAPLPLETRARASRELGVLVRCVVLLGAPVCEVGGWTLSVTADDAHGRVKLPEPPARRERGFALVGSDPIPVVRALAIVPAYNEADVIRRAVEDLIANGLDVYLLDNNSTDGTAEQVEDLRGKGLVRIERFPGDSGYAERNEERFVLRDQLRRFEEIAFELDYDWYLICDSDEFRESPWPGTTLAEGIGIAEAAGYNALQFELFNFRPTDDEFQPGTDVREHITGYEPPEWFDRGQIKAWRDTGVPADLTGMFGIGAMFPGRRVCPVPFILRHYPIRGATHGRRKVLRERLGRYAEEEKSDGWHIQYDRFSGEHAQFLWDPADLTEWDGDAVRAQLLSRASRSMMLANAVRAGDLESVQPSADAVAEWLARTVTGGRTPSATEIEAADFAVRRAFIPGVPEERLDPVAAGIARLTANERLLEGRIHDAGMHDDLVARLGTPPKPRFSALAFAEELIEDPALLADYGRQFGAADEATLVILAVGADTERLVQVVEAAGLEGDDTPDLLALTEPGSQPDAVHAVFSRRRAGEFASAPRVDDARALRALAEQRWQA